MTSDRGPTVGTLMRENDYLSEELTKAQAEIARLRAALEKINVGEGWAAQIARAALEGKQCQS